MDVTITEERLSEVLHKYLNTRIKGFDRCDYDWAEYNCGMGVCCDPYAIGFVLPKRDGNSLESDNHLFKLVDGYFYDEWGDYPKSMSEELPEVCKNPPNIEHSEYDTIIINEELYSTIRKFFGNINIWRNSLMILLNRVDGFNATTLMSTAIYDW